MAKSNRLSSLLSLGHSKHDSISSLSPSSSSSNLYDASQEHAFGGSGSAPQVTQSPSKNKLHKNASSGTYTPPPIDTMSMPLAPPPVLSSDGIARPPSSAGHLSRPGSRQASREASRSRPTTPSLLVPSDSATSLSRPQTPDSKKISKKRSWLPGKLDKTFADTGHHLPQAWIAGLREHVPYDLNSLLDGEKVSHLT